MKLVICDICLKKYNKIVKTSRWWTYRDDMSRLRIDVCNEHNKLFKDIKTIDEARKFLDNLKKN